MNQKNASSKRALTMNSTKEAGEMTCPVFVISLPDAAERRAYITEYFQSLGISFNFIDAVDGRRFKSSEHPAHDTFKRRLFFGRDLKGGEIGCTLSHRRCYEKMIEENIDIALIFEDDVVLDDDFSALVQNCLSHRAEFDILRFIKKPKLLHKPHKIIVPLFPSGDNKEQRAICKTHGVPGGAYAYLITQKGARKMIGVMQTFYLPVDTLMGQVWRTGLRSYVVMPGAVTVRDALGSDIGDDRFDKESLDVSGLWLVAHKVMRFPYKLYEALMRYIAYAL